MGPDEVLESIPSLVNVDHSLMGVVLDMMTTVRVLKDIGVIGPTMSPLKSIIIPIRN